MVNYYQDADSVEARRGPTWEPPIDIFETDQQLGIVIALPGVEPQQIEVRFDSLPSGGVYADGTALGSRWQELFAVQSGPRALPPVPAGDSQSFLPSSAW